MNFPHSSHTWLKLRTETWQPKSLSRFYAACSCAFLSGSPGSRTADPCHQLTTYGSTGFAGATPTRIPKRPLLRPCLASQKVYDHLWVVPWWEIFLPLEQKERDCQYWTLPEPVLLVSRDGQEIPLLFCVWETNKQQRRSLLFYCEIRPSVPFPRSLVRLTDSLTLLCNSSGPLPSFETFLFNKYCPPCNSLN